MSKWADYGISKVKYNSAGTHIEQVEVREDLGDKYGSPKIWTRADVLRYMDSGYSFITILSGSDGWKQGAKVEIVRYGNNRYLRTDGNLTPADNLGNLPRL